MKNHVNSLLSSAIFLACMATGFLAGRNALAQAPGPDLFRGANIVLSKEMIGEDCEFIIRDMKQIAEVSTGAGTTCEGLLFTTWGHGLGLLREVPAPGKGGEGPADAAGRPPRPLDLRIFSIGAGLAANRANDISATGDEIWVSLFSGIGLFTPPECGDIDRPWSFSREAAGPGAPVAPVHGILRTGDTLLVGTTGDGLYSRSGAGWGKVGPGEGFHADWVNILTPVPDKSAAPTARPKGPSLFPEDSIALAGTTKGAYWILKGPDGLITARSLSTGGFTCELINAALVFVHPESGREEIWIGTADAGIIRCRGNEWISHTAASGDLMSSEVTDLAFDGKASVIAGTREGVSLFSLSAAEKPASPEEGELHAMVDGLDDPWIKSVAFWRGRPIAGSFTGFVYQFDGVSWSPLVEGAIRLSPRRQ